MQRKCTDSLVFQAEFYPQTITETVFDILPRVQAIDAGASVTGSSAGVNFLERLWAYLTIKDLLERVAKGDLNSCSSSQNRPKRSDVDQDDEDYGEEGSGSSSESEYYYVEENSSSTTTAAPPADLEAVMDEVGDDENIVICDNIERALYLSLKYEFVTPLTSLVVVSPDADPREGDLSEVEGHNRRSAVNLWSLATANDAQAPIMLLLLSFTSQVLT